MVPRCVRSVEASKQVVNSILCFQAQEIGTEIHAPALVT